MIEEGDVVAIDDGETLDIVLSVNDRYVFIMWIDTTLEKKIRFTTELVKTYETLHKKGESVKL